MLSVQVGIFPKRYQRVALADALRGVYQASLRVGTAMVRWTYSIAVTQAVARRQRM